MKSLLIKDGRVIDPAQGIDRMGNILISEGKISWLGEGKKSPAQKDFDVLEAKGMIICPGFIDLHCHLREPGFEAKETIETGTRAAAKGGFTTICCMPNTNPAIDSKEMVESIYSKAASKGIIRVLPIGSITKGRKGKELSPMSDLAAAGVAAFSDDGDPVMDSNIMRQALELSRELNIPVSDHCEDKTLAAGGQMNEGVLSSRLGLRGMPAGAEENMIARDIALAKQTKGRMHIAHVSTAGSVDLIRRAKEEDINITAEVTPHHLTLTEEMVREKGSQAKVNPPLRTGKDIEALINGLRDGVIDIIATDHAPHTLADKQCEFSKAAFGISGFETAFGSLMGLVHAKKLDLNTIIKALTARPASVIGNRFGKLGTLAVGDDADITIFDPDEEWVVDTRNFASKGKNTPLAGSLLKGKVKATIFKGKMVFNDDSIKVRNVEMSF